MKLITEEKIKELQKQEPLKTKKTCSVPAKQINNEFNKQPNTFNKQQLDHKYGNNWIVTICLWLVLGHLGAHRLYLGLKSGITQMIFTFIWLPTILIVLFTSFAASKTGGVFGAPLVFLIVGCVFSLIAEIWQIVDFFLIMFGKIKNKSGEQIKVFRNK